MQLTNSNLLQIHKNIDHKLYVQSGDVQNCRSEISDDMWSFHLPAEDHLRSLNQLGKQSVIAMMQLVNVER